MCLLLLPLQNAALLYFKRFFSQASCVEHDAMRVMATCVYLACKVNMRSQVLLMRFGFATDLAQPLLVFHVCQPA